MTTPGKFRHLAQCSSPAGHFNILAIDHRGNLLSSLQEHAPEPITDADFIAFKRQVMRRLLPSSTAVLTDPEFGFGPSIADGTLLGQVGLLSPLEVTDYTDHPSRRVTNMIEEWSVGKIKRIGGSGVKLLLYYHPGAANAQGQRDIVASVAEECARFDIPFFLEPITYSLDAAKPLPNAELRKIVVESARTFSHMGIDVLKTEFPLNVIQEPDESIWTAALKELDAACAVPWALLSAGTTFEIFRRQVEQACRAGASGVIAGRAIWAEAVSLQGQAREKFLTTTARQRMEELSEICAQYAVSWRQKVQMPQVEPGWMMKYEDTC
jgi:tagatose 1,6-diphosphate aldolase